MRSLVSAHEGPAADAALAAIDAGGKRLRPLLVRAARPMSLDRSPGAAVAFDSCSLRAAAAVELIHTASLMHDDVLDGAKVRRGEPTAWHAAGRDVATRAGDLLFALAFATLEGCRAAADDARTVRAVRMLARTSRTLAEGEALQARQVRDTTLSPGAYMTRCERKTGVLFGTALQLGGVFGSVDDVPLDALGRFGMTVGTAFQVADDVLDCMPAGAERTIGKLPGADVRDGTITLPMLLAIEADPTIADDLARDDLAPDEVEALLVRIRDAGGVDGARRHALRMREDAVGIVRELAGVVATAPLLAIADRSVQRVA